MYLTHGGSESRENITLRGYEEDVHSVLRHLGEKPTIVVGHSMGGFLTQRAIEGNAHIRKASLISSVPPWGLLPSTLEPVVENMGDRLIPAVISSSKWREVADHVLRHLTN